MFNDKYGLTDAVLNGTKTQTRRFPSPRLIEQYNSLLEEYELASKNVGVPCSVVSVEDFLLERAPYKVGEVVAVAQSYKDANVAFVQLSDEAISGIKTNAEWGNPKKMAGWNNKRFVRAELMPHQIKITNVRIERLQDISDEDCLKEGIEKEERTDGKYFYKFFDARREVFVRLRTPREAFAVLTDKVNGMGTWWRNPYVFVYEFELVK